MLFGEWCFFGCFTLGDEGTMVFRNFGNHSLSDMASHSRKLKFSAVLL
jgi:hypothetical protein